MSITAANSVRPVCASGAAARIPLTVPIARIVCWPPSRPSRRRWG